MTFIREIHEPEKQNGDNAYWFVICNNEILLVTEQENYTIPYASGFQQWGIQSVVRNIYIGRYNGVPSYAVEIEQHIENKKNIQFISLRTAYDLVDPQSWQVAAYAAQIVDWDKNFTYCGRCGTRTENVPGERAKKCPSCGFIRYPRLSPAVIVAIVDGDRILLARAKRFKRKMYSVIAGFVEPGENFEGCVKREVHEEVGIEVTNICYFGSQPWPFPDCLMIGFTAEYKSGDARINDGELVEIGWYTAAQIPEEIPKAPSIARKLIDWFVAKNLMNGKMHHFLDTTNTAACLLS